ncbi:substrate-binding domain-containing protein [bacterium]|nr:substrate-binding domain-containing protein [bacterium]
MTGQRSSKHHRNTTGGRITIGVLTDWIEQRYQAGIYMGIADVAEKKPFNLMTFPIGSLREPYDFISQRNIIAGLVKHAHLDALIVLSGALSNYITYQELVSFIEQYRPIPMVSVGVPIQGIPNILTDNKKGMKDALAHLIEFHDCRRIAFIRGPEGHQEADERFQAYQQALSEHGLSIDPELVMHGDFYWTSGTRAVNELMDTRGKKPSHDFDALIASNDFMALSALKNLQDRNVQVPEDVAVIGFDNIEETSLIIPPLTTVGQPLYEIGEKSARMLLALLDGKELPEETVLPAELIIRQSCGCLSRAVLNICLNIPENPAPHPEKIMNAWFSKLPEYAGIGPEEPPVLQLLENFTNAINEDCDHRFIKNLNNILQRHGQANQRLSEWHDILSHIRAHAIAQNADFPDVSMRIDRLILQAHILVGDWERQVQCNLANYIESHSVTLSQVNAALISTLDLQAMMDVIALELPRLNIRRCYLVLYENPEGGELPEWSRCMLAYDERRRFHIEKTGIRFTTCQILPERMLPEKRRFALAVFPLFFQELHLGYILFEIEKTVPRHYEMLRHQISSALKGALLLQQHLKTEKELARSNEELEQFAYIASHDLQEPLRTISSYAQLLNRRLSDRLDEDTELFLNYLTEGARRMHTMIHDLLIYSRVSSHIKAFQPTDLNRLLQHVITDLSAVIGETRTQIQIETMPTVLCDSVLFERLFINLITNAIKYNKKRTPKIRISAVLKDREWTISIRDNGIGIHSEHHNKIFGVFERLHSRSQYEGTGIGLAICKKIVERHGGRIWVESTEGKGSTFHFSITTTDEKSSAETGTPE